MSEIVLLGLNHNTAPVSLRERVAFTREETEASLGKLINNPFIDELLIFSTCNRVEVLMTTRNCGEAVSAVKAHISEVKVIAREKYETALYTYKNEQAVRHLFNVASSLDSMIIGEPQILGQVKDAYRLATEKGTSGVILNRLLHRTFFVAKKVRSETGIGGSAVSISYAAIELGRKIFGSLDGRKVLLIGAGEMAELAVEHLIQNKSGKIFVANRTFKRAVDLADQFNGQAIGLGEIVDNLQFVDIVISSTGSPDFMITKAQVKQQMRKRKNRPIFFIDIAVPRDIDPDINRLNNTYVYDIDDLKGVVDENMGERKNEAAKGERIVDQAVIKFWEWYANLDVVPTIVALRNKMDRIARAEMEKTFSMLKHLSEHDQEAINRMIEAVIKKTLHDPTIFLKSTEFHGHKDKYLDITRKLFKLD